MNSRQKQQDRFKKQVRSTMRDLTGDDRWVAITSENLHVDQFDTVQEAVDWFMENSYKPEHLQDFE